MMHFKIIFILLVLGIELISFFLASEKFIYATKKKERVEYLIMLLAALTGFIVLINTAVYII